MDGLRRRRVRSKKNISKHNIRIFEVIVILVGLFFVCMVLFLSTAFIPFFKITNIEIQGNQEISGNILKSKIQEELQKKILWLVPTNNIFLIKTKKLEKNILNNFPNLKSLKIYRSNFQTLRVIAVERNFTSLWCNDTLDNCYLVDENGIAYEKYPTNSSTSDLLIIKNMSFPYLFKTVISSVIYTDILKSLTFLSNLGFKVKEVKIKNQGEFVFTLEKGGLIKLSNDFYFNLINKFPLLLEEYKWQSGMDFEYIDLRFPSKAFIK